MTNTTTTANKGYTVHGVLAGAYRGKGKANNFRDSLDHASTDDGETALCGRVKPGSLADTAHHWNEAQNAFVDATEPSCPHCRRKVGL